MKKSLLTKVAIFFTIGFFISNYLYSQIVYTDIVPDSVVSASATENVKLYYLDMDNDGTEEFELQHFNTGGSIKCVELHGEVLDSKEVIVDENNHAIFSNKDDEIGPNSTIWGYDAYGCLTNSWYTGEDKYFALRFKINGNWHYGWARILVPTDKLSFIIKDYAYNQIPDEAIKAGQKQTTSILYNSHEKDLNILYNTSSNAVIISSSTELSCAKLLVYNSNGQKVNTSVIKSTNSIQLNTGTLSRGIYIIQVIEDSGKVFTGTFVKS